MRVPDTLIQNSFMVNLNKNKRSLIDIQTQLTTQSKVNKPSDNPLSNSRIMRMQNQLNSIYTYQSNINYARSILDDGIQSMEAMQNEILNVQVQLTQLNSAIVSEDLTSFAESIDSSLEILVEMANSEFNGQYNFAGTESNKKPFYYDKSNNRVVSNSDNIGGEKVVKISSGITQKYNISGKELFQSVFTQSGSLDSTAGIGVAQTDSSTIYDAEGNEYTLNLEYSMTAANTYELDYTILDSDAIVVENQTVSDLKFNSATGEFESLNGDSFGEIHIQNTANKIDFQIDLSTLSENTTATNLNSSLSQKADIFNTLLAIKEGLLAGEKPSEEQVDIVNDFNQHVLNKLSSAGGISNKLQATEGILLNKEFEISGLLSIEKDVDMARALLDLESAQYTLDISYKISSMILPKSLLDYL
jgi:flagellar hook-associated protein 3 FlgL